VYEEQRALLVVLLAFVMVAWGAEEKDLRFVSESVKDIFDKKTDNQRVFEADWRTMDTPHITTTLLVLCPRLSPSSWVFIDWRRCAESLWLINLSEKTLPTMSSTDECNETRYSS